MFLCVKGSSNLVTHLEKGFYHLGCFIARRPWIIIFTSLFITSICSIGLINLRFETDANKIWGPDSSIYISNNKWLSEHFPQDKRVQTLIFQSEENGNILSPQSLKLMMKLHKLITKLQPQNITFQDICHR